MWQVEWTHCQCENLSLSLSQCKCSISVYSVRTFLISVKVIFLFIVRLTGYSHIHSQRSITFIDCSIHCWTTSIPFFCFITPLYPICSLCYYFNSSKPDISPNMEYIFLTSPTWTDNQSLFCLLFFQTPAVVQTNTSSGTDKHQQWYRRTDKHRQWYRQKPAVVQTKTNIGTEKHQHYYSCTSTDKNLQWYRSNTSTTNL